MSNWKGGPKLVERDIVRHCLARLEDHMAPKLVEFVDEGVVLGEGHRLWCKRLAAAS